MLLDRDILMPVLDNEKHYWVGPDEVNKLLERGRDWLAEHPERDLIVSRYLRFRRDLSQRALSELTPLLEEEPEEGPSGEEDVERRIGLHDLRLDAVAAVLEKDNVRTVADLGCGEGRLLRRLIKNKNLSRILACDVSSLALERAAASLERMNERQREKVQLFQSSLLYADARLAEVDAAVLVEVIEHIEPDRLPRVADNLFGRMRPRIVILTTPNREYNVVWESLPAGRLRHGDHRFEWTRQEFQEWASQVKSDYHVEFQDLGEPHPELGAPSQMAVFRR